MRSVVMAVAGVGLAAGSAFGQATDNCAAAPTVGPGIYTFDTTSATPDGTATCGSSNATPDVWLRFMPPASGVVDVATCGLTTMDTVLSAYGGCGGTQLACNDDACQLQSRITLTVTQGTPVLIRISGFLGTTGSGSVRITPPGGAWDEGATDAGDVPATAQIPQGPGALNAITGSLSPLGDVDMFRISVCDRATFRASTVGGTDMDTMIALFTLDGRGVTFDDDDPSVGLASTITNQFVVNQGEYYLAITTYNHRPLGASGDIWLADPFEVERQPDGPAAGEPVTHWEGETFDEGAYVIFLDGVCYPTVTPACVADLDDGTRAGHPDGAVTIDDLVYYLILFEDGAIAADLDNGTRTGTTDGAVTIDDLIYFLIHFEDGC